MNVTDKNKSIPTIPKGIWESPHTDKNKKEEKRNSNTPYTDLQGNGYPINKQGKA